LLLDRPRKRGLHLHRIGAVVSLTQHLCSSRTSDKVIAAIRRHYHKDAIEQYERDRDPREKLFEFGRCVVHLAVDEEEVRMCTHLKARGSWFLPLNQGWNDGAGNPPNPDGLKTDYLWKHLLTPHGVTNIIENYTQIVEERDLKTGRKKAVQIFPRYHQLDVVRKLHADVVQHGAGKRYLIQHSAGSGKSNSIAWLAHQLIGLRKDEKDVFDSIIVITDRRLLDQQIQATIKQFAQVSATVGHAEHSGDLRKFIEGGKKIIISTVQKFPFILDEIGDEHRGPWPSRCERDVLSSGFPDLPKLQSGRSPIRHARHVV
jgi:type I restriction enzyme R subunit